MKKAKKKKNKQKTQREKKRKRVLSLSLFLSFFLSFFLLHSLAFFFFFLLIFRPDAHAVIDAEDDDVADRRQILIDSIQLRIGLVEMKIGKHLSTRTSVREDHRRQRAC